MKSILLTATALFMSSISIAQEIPDFEDPVRLSEEVNSEAEESMPLLTSDGKTMYIVRTLHASNTGGNEDQDIWISQNGDGPDVWKKATNPKSPLNSDQTNGVVGVSKDGNTLYLLNGYGVKAENLRGIAKSTKKGSSWSKPERVNVPNLSFEGTFYGFYITPEEDLMFISMKAENGFGEEDLYLSKKDASGNWSSPINLGANINTTGFEISPWLSPDKKTLYFASSSHGANGMSDIFMASREDDSFTKWSKPVNMGAPINSDKFDAYFTIRADSTVYLASNRDAEYADIYYSKIKEPLVAVVEDTIPPDTIPVIIPTPNLPLMPYIVHFDFDRSSLRGSEPDSLDAVAEHMNKNPSLILEVTGHCDHTGDKEYNYRLSKRRVNRVVEYLVAKGVAKERIPVVLSFGKDKPVADNSTKEGRQLNRRVEINFKRQPEQ